MMEWLTKRDAAKQFNILDVVRDLVRRVQVLERLAFPTAVADVRYAAVLRATTTWDPASLGKQTATSTTITVNGAAVGDVALAGHDLIGSNVALLSAYVEAANTVRVVLFNPDDTNSLDVSSGTLTVVVFR